MKRVFYAACFVVVSLLVKPTIAQQPAAKVDTSRGDKMLAEYFAAETRKLQEACLADIQTLEDWKAKRGEYRRQLHEMLGLDPLPEKTDLKPVITGRLEQEDFVVEKLYFQSRPGLYVTGNLYLPKKIEKPLPTILYVCGHSVVKVNDVAMGAKAGYQHHGAWYARNGYACLTIDTLQLGEIEGIHHGTHRYGMWWWLNRGYTPAGVEAWNCVRALDYLETRPEVDKTRFGVTGRSGGGAYSWWIAAIDERIKVAVPTAGITDMQNHVVDGCVEGHCDCMFMVNTYRWDYPQVAALVAPRPLLISNTDNDRIFPLDGVVRTFDKVRRIYRLYDKEKKGTGEDVALNISPGPHKDTQELNTHEFRWFNHYLKKDDSPIDSRAPKYFKPEELKVFVKLPEDQINTKIHETFVAKAGDFSIPRDNSEWMTLRDSFKEAVKAKSMRGWFSSVRFVDLFGSRFATQSKRAVRDGISLTTYDFLSDPGWNMKLYVVQQVDIKNQTSRLSNDLNPTGQLVVQPTGMGKPDLRVLNVLDEERWQDFQTNIASQFEAATDSTRQDDKVSAKWDSLRSMLKANPWSMVYFCPRGVGSTAFDTSERKQIQNRRRYYLLGTSLDAMQAYDVAWAIRATQTLDGLHEPSIPVWLEAHGRMAGVALYASIFESNVQRASAFSADAKQLDLKRLDLYDLPKSHRDGPYLLNVERFLDMPQAVTMAAERSKVVLYQDDDKGWEYPQAVAKALNWPEKQIQIRRKPASE